MKSKFCINKRLFSLGMSMLLLLFISACSSNNSGGGSSSHDSATTGTYSISGKVTEGDVVKATGRAGIALAGDGLPGVTMTLGGDASDTITTGAGGSYSFTGLGNGNYTVTPSLTGRTFSYVSKVITINGVSGSADFVGTTCEPDGYGGISGAVYFDFDGYGGYGGEILTSANNAVKPANNPVDLIPPGLAGVTITLHAPPSLLPGTVSALNGAMPILGTTLTDGSGNYSFTGLANGSYIVVASKTGYTINCDTGICPSKIVNNDTQRVDFIGYADAYAQTDLEATWNVHMLRTGTSDKWKRGIFTFNSSGSLTAASSCLDSNGDTTCPAALVLTMDSATGVITSPDEVGAGSAGVVTPMFVSTSPHYTMTANKNFIVGTATSSSGNYDLRIFQKVVPEVVYSNVDLWNKSFVYHGMSVGATKGWAHGTGTTDGAGVVTMGTSNTSGGAMTLPDGLAISVNSAGVVSISDVPTFQGFLSADRKTIVGTFTTDASYQLIIIQITGQTFLPPAPSEVTSVLDFLHIKPLCEPGFMPYGYSAGHALANGGSLSQSVGIMTPSAAPVTDFWGHYTIYVNGTGLVYAYNADWVSDPTVYIGDSIRHGLIGLYGEITMTDETTYNGQMSHDGEFNVSTQTQSGFSVLSVDMRGWYDAPNN